MRRCKVFLCLMLDALWLGFRAIGVGARQNFNLAASFADKLTLRSQVVGGEFQSVAVARARLMASTTFGSALSNTASSIGSGASPVQVLMQQAPDLMQAFGGGGLGGALKSVKDFLVSMVTPSRVLGVTLAGAGLAAASSFWRAHEAQLALSGL